jgi:hypothetical protein
LMRPNNTTDPPSRALLSGIKFAHDGLLLLLLCLPQHWILCCHC